MDLRDIGVFHDVFIFVKNEKSEKKVFSRAIQYHEIHQDPTSYMVQQYIPYFSKYSYLYIVLQWYKYVQHITV